MNKKIVAIIGRPNVGKSTLFNRLAIRKKAIVHDRPGVTRDRKYADAQIGPFDFTVIDTPGLEKAEDEKLEYRMMQQTMEAILEADLLCLVVDGKDGVLPEDQFFANFIRRYNKKSVLIVNKCEGRFDFAKEYYKLGFDNVVPISAEHGVGMADLYDAITEELGSEKGKEELIDQLTDPIKANYIQIVVSGRPNAGKSTFINSLINDERLLTGPEAGITRESIEIDWLYNDNKFKLIDTAGLRKKGTVTKSLEKLSSSDAINSIKFANTVILMVDARSPLEQQDLNIANYVIDQGRSLLIVVNKWDLIEGREQDKFKEEFSYKIETSLPQVKGLPIIFISALKKQNINMVLDESIKIYNLWNKKITTSKLNDWLGFALEQHPLPLQKGGRRIRIKYMTQTKIRPPTFKLFSNNPEKITDSYTRYLINSLRAAFNLPGIPIRFIYTKTENPYVKSHSKKHIFHAN